MNERLRVDAGKRHEWKKPFLLSTRQPRADRMSFPSATAFGRLSGAGITHLFYTRPRIRAALGLVLLLTTDSTVSNGSEVKPQLASRLLSRPASLVGYQLEAEPGRNVSLSGEAGQLDSPQLKKKSRLGNRRQGSSNRTSFVYRTLLHTLSQEGQG